MSFECGAEEEDYGFGVFDTELPSSLQNYGKACSASGGCQSQGCGSSNCGSSSGKDKNKSPQSASADILRKCSKCKENAAQIVGNMKEPLCGGCLRSNLLGKFKTCVNRHGLIARQDHVLLGFSGGHSSRAALELLNDFRSRPKHKNVAAADRGRIAFDLAVCYIDEKAIVSYGRGSQEQGSDIIEIVGGYEDVQCHIVELENLFSSSPSTTASAGGECCQLHETECSQAAKSGSREDSSSVAMGMSSASEQCSCSTSSKAKLQRLWSMVHDNTGREDLLESMRKELLVQVAKQHGYTKIVLGDSISRTAARVLAATIKGQGHSMLGDIHYLDARREVPFIWPLRDCVGRELALFCHLHRLKTAFAPAVTTLGGPPGATINSLSDMFVRAVQQDNPSRESTIVRTAYKLLPFPFSSPEALPSPSARPLSLPAGQSLATRKLSPGEERTRVGGRGKGVAGGTDEATSVEAADVGQESFRLEKVQLELAESSDGQKGRRERDEEGLEEGRELYGTSEEGHVAVRDWPFAKILMCSICWSPLTAAEVAGLEALEESGKKWLLTDGSKDFVSSRTKGLGVRVSDKASLYTKNGSEVETKGSAKPGMAEGRDHSFGVGSTAPMSEDLGASELVVGSCCTSCRCQILECDGIAHAYNGVVELMPPCIKDNARRLYMQLFRKDFGDAHPR